MTATATVDTDIARDGAPERPRMRNVTMIPRAGYVITVADRSGA